MSDNRGTKYLAQNTTAEMNKYYKLDNTENIIQQALIMSRNLYQVSDLNVKISLIFRNTPFLDWIYRPTLMSDIAEYV